MIVLAKCKMCGKSAYIPHFKCGGAGCDECLKKLGRPAHQPNRGLLKRKRIKVRTAHALI